MKLDKETTGMVGLLAGTVPMASIFIAISVSPWFSFTNSFLSDLGGNVISAVVFNMGLMFGGILGTLFAWGLYTNKIYRNKIGLKSFMLATVSLFLVGAFPLTTGWWHTAPSVMFFLCSTVSMILIGWTERRRKRFPWFIFILGIISLAAAPLYVVPRPIGFNAITELVTSLAMAAFVLMTSLKLLTEP